MRVISGSARGRRLQELKGMSIRPTTDKVKESMFNIVQFEILGRRVLDLFGGTGQLGIECLSRGAAEVLFVEQSREAVSVMQGNLRLTGLEGQARVVQGDALSFLATCRESFDLIFVDPPYHTNLLEQAVASIAKFDILREHGIMVCESTVEQTVTLPPHWTGRTYQYGKVKLTVCHREGSHAIG